MEELTGVDMIEKRQRILIFALLALLLIFAGCKAESPTTPTVTTPGGPTGGVTPPTGANITLSVSNPTPVVNSNVVITATVTQNNQNVPNGTAVQFTTNLGTFTDTGTASVIKTTTDGVAKATLTSAVAGTATVVAVVNNASKSITVTFGVSTTMPPPTSTAPTITSVTPASGKPEGGDIVTITGTNFVQPVRVLFDPGTASGQAPKEGFVSSVSSTSIVVVTPKFDVVSGSSLTTDVIVITQAGTTGEQRVVKTGGFVFASANLTPAIRAVQPTSGPISGGTRVTIFGDNFQLPVQVFFNVAEAQVISVTFNQIIVMSPRASDTAAGGSGVVTGPVDVIVKNINSGKSVTLSGGFRYIPKMVITTAGPTEGPFSGGTRVTIDGSGFSDPLAVTMGAFAAQVIRVSGSEVVAISPAIQPMGCNDVLGPITVTNTDNGDSATGPTFTFRVPKPLIISISPNPANLGGSVNVTVLGAVGFARITIGETAANIVSSMANADGTTTFVVTVPPTLTLAQTSCPGGGSAPIPTQFDVTFTSATTGCTNTSPKGLTVNPAVAPILFVSPLAFQPFMATFNPGMPPMTPPSETPSGSQTVTVTNTGTAPLNITAITQTNGAGAGCADFSIVVPPPPVTLNQCESIPVIVSFNGPTPAATGTDTCTLTLTTNAGNKSFLLVGTSR
jgi:hypothetical protein